jgi:hypothetical protein
MRTAALAALLIAACSGPSRPEPAPSHTPTVVAPDAAPVDPLQAELDALATFDASTTREAIDAALTISAANRVDLVPALAAALERAHELEDPSAPIVTLGIVNALGPLRSPDAVTPLLRAMYRFPKITQQARRALVQQGAPAAAEVRAILAGNHAAINELLADDTSSAKVFYAAIIAGDLHDTDAIVPLVVRLGEPAAPAYIIDGMPGPVQHVAILDALARIGDARAAQPVLALLTDGSADVALRGAAAATYGVVSWAGEETHAGKPGLEHLAVIALDKSGDQGLRLAAAEAYGRLAASTKDLEPLVRLVAQYAKAAADHDKQLRRIKDPDERDAAKQISAGYRAFQRAIELHVACVVFAAPCQHDPVCLLATAYDTSGADALAELVKGKYVEEGTWSEAELAELRDARIERALVEVAKRGEDAASQLTRLLVAVSTTDRLQRMLLLRAIVRIAPRPCEACEEVLDDVIAADEGNTALGALTHETKLVRLYFASAGK